jgi:hypothetical protein
MAPVEEWCDTVVGDVTADGLEVAVLGIVEERVLVADRELVENEDKEETEEDEEEVDVDTADSLELDEVEDAAFELVVEVEDDTESQPFG